MLAICSFKRGEKAFNPLFYPAVDQPFHPLPVGYKGQANSLGAVVAEKIYIDRAALVNHFLIGV